MLPATKAILKKLLPVYVRPFIERLVKQVIAVGVIEIICVTRGGKETLENHYG
jgi:UTP--glucose-1-phosphate uridylyltransferase